MLTLWYTPLSIFLRHSLSLSLSLSLLKILSILRKKKEACWLCSTLSEILGSFALWKRVHKQPYMLFFFFSQCFFKTFNQTLITIRDGWAHNRVNCWSEEFFQSIIAWTWTREFLVKSKTTTLRLSVQPLG